jgi:hypothetical protein
MASPRGGQRRLMFFDFRRRAARTAAPRVDRTRFCPLPGFRRITQGSRVLSLRSVQSTLGFERGGPSPECD